MYTRLITGQEICQRSDDISDSITDFTLTETTVPTCNKFRCKYHLVSGQKRYIKLWGNSILCA